MRRVESPATAVRLVLACLAILAATPTSTFTADALVPPSVQAMLTLRILEYDRSLKSWAGGKTLLLGVVSKEKNGAVQYRRAIEGQGAQGVTILTAVHVYRDPASLSRWIQRDDVRLVYLSPDLAAEAEAAIAAVGARNVCSITLSRERFGLGGTLGMVIKDARPHILVHLPRSKAAGMDLDPKLLQLAEVVR